MILFYDILCNKMRMGYSVAFDIVHGHLLQTRELPFFLKVNSRCRNFAIYAHACKGVKLCSIL